MDYMQVIENWRKDVVGVSVYQIPSLICSLILVLEKKGFTQDSVSVQLIDKIVNVFINPDTLEKYKKIQRRYLNQLVKEHMGLSNSVRVSATVDDSLQPKDVFIDEKGNEREWTVDPIKQSASEIDMEDYDHEFLAQLGMKAEDIIR